MFTDEETGVLGDDGELAVDGLQQGDDLIEQDDQREDDGPRQALSKMNMANDTGTAPKGEGTVCTGVAPFPWSTAI